MREDPLELVKQMEKEGLQLKTSGRFLDITDVNQVRDWTTMHHFLTVLQLLVGSDDEAEAPGSGEPDDVKWLDTLSTKEKKRLFKQLRKAEKEKSGSSKRKEKKERRSKSRKDSSSGSDSDSDDGRSHKKKKRKHRGDS